MYSYQIYKSQDSSNDRVNKAREGFGKQHLDCYVILHDGQMQIIQFEDFLPYPGTGLQESARKHVEALDEIDRISEHLATSEDTITEGLVNEAIGVLKAEPV